MKCNDFMNTARRIANETPTRYMGGGVGQHDGDTFLFDCGGLIKSILWGFCFDYNQYRGGAIYGSNGVPDVDCDTFFNSYCYDKSNDFNNIEVGELIYMPGHIGIYAGDRNVIEATAAWENKVLVSQVGTSGQRTHNGGQVYNWTSHGKCQFIEYDKPQPEPTPEPPKPVERKFKEGDKVILNGHLYYDSYGNGRGQMRENYVTIIGIVNYDTAATKPYNVGNGEGWVDERNLKLYVEPEPTPEPEIVKGTRVRVIGDGYGTSYGESPMCRYRYEGYIGLDPMLDRPYPYCVYDDDGAVAWYKREDLEIL